MAFEITIPRLGWSMEEGTFVRWLKQDGDQILPGDPLFELEGEKAAQDVEAVDGGILRISPESPEEGAIVAVGTVIGYLTAAGEAIPASLGAVARGIPAHDATFVSGHAADSGSMADLTVKGASAPAAPPSVRRMARERGIDLTQVTGSGPAGRIFAADLQLDAPIDAGSSSAKGSTVASPRARRVAKELGIDWTGLAGSGRNGRVRERDVRASADSLRQNVVPIGRLRSGEVPGMPIPLSRHRRAIADQMIRSRQTTAPVTITTRIDATNLVSLRQQFKTDAATVPSYTDIVVKLVSIALADHRQLMAQWSDDQLIVPDVINIGIAVDTDAGLLVPVIRNVPSLSLMELTRVSTTLIAQARAGLLKFSEMQGGVFTVTSLGAYGIDAFTPIINPPQTAILGLGQIRRDPAVFENQIVPRDQMTLSLTFDHRIVDGAPAARFLQSVRQALESPSAWLLRPEREPR